MFTTYRDSVLDYAGADGTIALKIIEQLFDEHGLSTEEWFDIATDTEAYDAETILGYLGY
jgi:hypothetical protein